METKRKFPCSYGSKCYRKNPKHFETYSHPSDLEEGKEMKLENSPEKQKMIEKTRRRCQKKMQQTTLLFGSTEGSKRRKLSELKKEETDIKGNKMKNTNKLKHNKGMKLSNQNLTNVNLMNRTSEIISLSSVKKNPEVTGANRISPSGSCNTHSSSWTFLKKNESDVKTTEENLNEKSVMDKIKYLFLFDMPKCFYSFFEFCKSLDCKDPNRAIDVCGLKLAGPFDALLGKLNINVDKEIALCHWRYYYDPPEFQTVLASNSNSSFHIGYWRDDPNELPVFVASNNCDTDCVFKIEAENLFGAVYHYLSRFLKACDPFMKIKVTKFQTALKEWALQNKFSLEKRTTKMAARQRKVVTATFHKAGIVVPVEKKTELGYRPLIETEDNIKKICKLITEADNESERETMWENLQPLINAANIANDECDFGNSLELGIDLFCTGSSIFHETVEHLLSTAYSLLGRNQFEDIIRAHLKRRKSGSVIDMC